jgi:hypothetical protein
MNTSSFKEDHVSQFPALQLLQNLGYITEHYRRNWQAMGFKAQSR